VPYYKRGPTVNLLSFKVSSLNIAYIVLDISGRDKSSRKFKSFALSSRAIGRIQTIKGQSGKDHSAALHSLALLLALIPVSNDRRHKQSPCSFTGTPYAGYPHMYVFFP
jgi:hypothetical protein